MTCPQLSPLQPGLVPARSSCFSLCHDPHTQHIFPTSLESSPSINSPWNHFYSLPDSNLSLPLHSVARSAWNTTCVTTPACKPGLTERWRNIAQRPRFLSPSLPYSDWCACFPFMTSVSLSVGIWAGGWVSITWVAKNLWDSFFSVELRLLPSLFLPHLFGSLLLAAPSFSSVPLICLPIPQTNTWALSHNVFLLAGPSQSPHLYIRTPALPWGSFRVPLCLQEPSWLDSVNIWSLGLLLPRRHRFWATVSITLYYIIPGAGPICWMEKHLPVDWHREQESLSPLRIPPSAGFLFPIQTGTAGGRPPSDVSSCPCFLFWGGEGFPRSQLWGPGQSQWQSSQRQVEWTEIHGHVAFES